MKRGFETFFRKLTLSEFFRTPLLNGLENGVLKGLILLCISYLAIFGLSTRYVAIFAKRSGTDTFFRRRNRSFRKFLTTWGTTARDPLGGRVMIAILVLNSSHKSP